MQTKLTIHAMKNTATTTTATKDTQAEGLKGLIMLSHSGRGVGLSTNTLPCALPITSDGSKLPMRSLLMYNGLIVKFFSFLVIMPNNPTQDPFSMTPHFKSGDVRVKVYVKFNVCDIESRVFNVEPLPKVPVADLYSYANGGSFKYVAR